MAAATLLLAFAQPAGAATKPSKVGLVSIIAGTTSSLTLQWPKAAHATKYEVLVATNEAMSKPKVHSAGTHLSLKVTRLTRGKVYCFVVRAKNGSTVGAGSAHTCKPTVRGQGATSGTRYTVMTYNVCSYKGGTAGCDREHTWDFRGPLAKQLILTKVPDVVAAQESDYLDELDGYTLAYYKSGKRLFYKTSRFDLAQTTVDCPTDPAPGDAPTCEPGTVVPRTGFITMGPGKYAVWAELIDHSANDKHVIFVSVHTTSGKSDTYARRRAAEITTLLEEMTTLNPDNLPVIFAGDFNSNRHRTNDYLAAVFHKAGYWDAYDLAGSLTRPNYNSYNGFRKNPIISTTWGDHVDHIWVKTSISVRKWEGVAFYSNGRYTTLPSDHSPVMATLTVK